LINSITVSEASYTLHCIAYAISRTWPEWIYRFKYRAVRKGRDLCYYFPYYLLLRGCKDTSLLTKQS